jgi:hypothetical protein
LRAGRICANISAHAPSALPLFSWGKALVKIRYGLIFAVQNSFIEQRRMKMRQQVSRRLLRTLVAVTALGATTGMNLSRAALAQEAISVNLNGQPISFGGVPPTQVGGRVLVPLRGVFEALGAQVDYDSASGTVFAARGETQVQLRIGSTQATVNGEARVLDVPAQTRLGRTLVPLRFVSEAMGAQVTWNPGTRLVSITGTTDVSDPNGPFGPGPRATPTPRPDPIYIPPVNAGRTVTGTVVKVDPTAPANITLRVGTAFRTFVWMPTRRSLARRRASFRPAPLPCSGRALR